MTCWEEGDFEISRTQQTLRSPAVAWPDSSDSTDSRSQRSSSVLEKMGEEKEAAPAPAEPPKEAGEEQTEAKEGGEAAVAEEEILKFRGKPWGPEEQR